MHQHRDEKGVVFGAPHPLEAHHYNEKTLKRHNWTVAWEATNGV